jgi:nucleotide-binding universal stress UspA family protein
MSVALAALDDSAAARPVLDAAVRAAALLHADLLALHVREHGSGATARAVAEARGVPVLVRDAPDHDVARAVLDAQHELHTALVAVGVRGVPSATRPIGHLALRLAQELTAAVLLVPPTAGDRPIRRVLVAVEGDGESEELVALVGRFDEAGPELVALHVFAPEDLPLFGDEPVLETEAWAREFLRRAASAAFGRVRLEVRVGNVVEVVPDAVDELAADLVVMGWHCTVEGGHGRIVQRMLESTRVPVLLLPIGRHALSGATQDV